MRASGVPAIARPYLRGQGVIFCFHHVLPGGGRQQGFSPNSKLECEPQFLRGLIELVRKRGYETLSLSDAVARLKSNPHSEKPFAVFTLDDGYKDNREFAQPVFQKYNCPYTIFVAPRFADGTSEIWWRNLEHIIARNENLHVEVAGAVLDLHCASESEKWNAWHVLYPIFEKLDQFQQRIEIRKLALGYTVDVDGYCRSVAMDWRELGEMARDPLCELGAHTVNHYAVGRMNEIDARAQLADARQLMGKHLGKAPRFNAYPYGDEPNATARDFKLAEDVGYDASLTTRKGVTFAGHAKHLQALPRIMISGRYQDLGLVDTLISGLPTALSNRFRRVNVS